MGPGDPNRLRSLGRVAEFKQVGKKHVIYSCSNSTIFVVFKSLLNNTSQQSGKK